MTHPDVLAALSALHRAREAWPWLADLIEAGPADRRTSRYLSPAAAARRDQLLRAERADRIAGDRMGLKRAGASPAPINLSIVDAQQAALTALTDQAWVCASALRRRKLLAYGPVWEAFFGDRWGGAGAYLQIALQEVPLPMAVMVGRTLDRIDREIRRAAGVGPQRRALHKACPACGVWLLRAEVSAPEAAQWIVRCDNDECRCRGLLCDCKMPNRAQFYGRRHLWGGEDWATQHGPLAKVLQGPHGGVWRPDGWYGRPGELAEALGVTEVRVRDWLKRSRKEGDRLHGRIATVDDKGAVWARLDDCALVKYLVEHSPRGRRPAEGVAA